MASTILEKKNQKFFNPFNNSGTDFKIFFIIIIILSMQTFKEIFIFFFIVARYSHGLATCCRTFIDFSYRLLPVVPFVVERKEGEDESADNCSLLSI